MDDNSSRRTTEDFNPFSFVSFLKQHSDNEDLPHQETEDCSTPSQDNGQSDDNSNPFSIKKFAKLKTEKMFPKLPTVSTDSEDECNTYPDRNLDNNPENIHSKRSLVIMEDPGMDVHLPPPKDFDCLSNNETLEAAVFSDDDTIDDITTEDLQEIHLRNKLYMSQSEINNLHQQLEDAQKTKLEKEKRIEELESELKKVKIREAEDTATLEKMMHSIENNLKLTTERAVMAETQVSKLKQELKTLQSQMVMLEEQLASSVREDEMSRKAQDIAQKLNMAANQAEVSLKDLLDGVGQLRLLSSLVGDITKVTEPT